MENTDRDLQRQLEYYEGLSFEREFLPAGGLTSFNINYGYLESILRGFRSGFLNETSYRTLTQVSSLDEFKVALVDTDYNGCLDDAGGEQKVTTEFIMQQCKKKFADEFMFVRTQATGALKTFMDHIRQKYMIDNIMILLRGMVNGNPIEELIEDLNPIGLFPEIKTVLTFNAQDSEGGLNLLFETVLIDTPVGHLFERYFADPSLEESDVKNMLNRDKIDYIGSYIEKFWLEEFYKYCLKLGGETSEQMKELLEFEADARAIRISKNSFKTGLNEGPNKDDRQKLFCSFGKLYPEGIEAFRRVRDKTELYAVLSKYPMFRECYESAASSEKDIDDTLNEAEVHLNEFCFWGQNHFAAFWGFVKLKEQELRNIYWIADCIVANRRDNQSMNHWVPILS